MTSLPLAEWRDFYVMIGTAAGVIIGATFIVATLAADMEQKVLGLRGFITPVAVHLGSVLVGSAILVIPTLTPSAFVVLLGAGGIAGTIYCVVVARRVSALKLDLDDRIFYIVLPILTYPVMTAAAAMTFGRGMPALETLAAALVILLIIGMRNSWDMATFMITRPKQG
ncbi:MAG TPA: hypothetical protein VN154_01205 [Rhizomicrobium sp.]|nr:hypothetical protein [Rhizomicrobium sp.]